ncbi:hypothetical protein [Actinomadura xylanilytica]|nr:hypothetical protein [Actinomadura xylanilytica]MDL4773265.1 hypothetical protein [Actinomadura xylanilytica]
MPDRAHPATRSAQPGLLIAEMCADKIGHDVSAAGQITWAEFCW